MSSRGVRTSPCNGSNTKTEQGIVLKVVEQSSVVATTGHGDHSPLENDVQVLT